MSIKYLTLVLFLFSPSAFGFGSLLNNFRPLGNGLDFITQPSSRVLEPGELNAGSFLHFATNSLPHSNQSSLPSNQQLGRLNDSVLYSNIHLSVGVAENFEVSLLSSFIHAQEVDNQSFLFNYGDMGINDIGFQGKANVLSNGPYGLAVIAGILFDQVKNNPLIGNNPGPLVNLQVAADYSYHSDWLFGANIGYNHRESGDTIPATGVTPVGEQLTYGLSGFYQLSDEGSALIAELFGGSLLDVDLLPTDRKSKFLELQLGYRHRHDEALDLHGGLATQLIKGLGSPDLRLFLGAQWRTSVF